MKNEEFVSWSVLACLHILTSDTNVKPIGLISPQNTTTTNKNQCHKKAERSQEQPKKSKIFGNTNSEYLQVFEIDLSWTMFKSELYTIANSLKNQLEVAKDKISTGNRLNCQVLPKLLDIQHDICSFVVQMLQKTSNDAIEIEKKS